VSLGVETSDQIRDRVDTSARADSQTRLRNQKVHSWPHRSPSESLQGTNARSHHRKQLKHNDGAWYARSKVRLTPKQPNVKKVKRRAGHRGDRAWRDPL
jgi:hypothetical protein